MRRRSDLGYAMGRSLRFAGLPSRCSTNALADGTKALEGAANLIEHSVHAHGVFEDANLNCSPHDVHDAQAKLHGVAIDGPSKMAKREQLPRRARAASMWARIGVAFHGLPGNRDEGSQIHGSRRSRASNG